MDPDRQAIFGFDPRSIPGLGLWLDAADSNTITVTAGNVSSWMDKSSNGITFSNGALTGRRGPTREVTQNGLDVLTFRANGGTDVSGQFLSSTRTLTFDCNTHTICMVHRPTITTAIGWGDSGVTVFSNETMGRVIFPFPLSASGSAYTNNTGSDYLFTNDVSTAYNLLIANIGPQSARVFRNGVQTSPAASGGGQFFYASVYDASVTIGARAAISNFFSGTLAEVLVFPRRSISPIEQFQVESYLAWKWGLQSNFPQTYPFSSNPALQRQFTPIDIPGCIVWFDAADTATLTTSGTNVTSWRNKGILGISATSPVGTISTGYTFNTSPLNTLQFPGGSYFTASNVVTTTPDRTQFFIFTVTSYGDGYSRIFASSTGTGNRQSGFNAWNRDTNTINLFPAAHSATDYVAIAGRAPYSGTLPYDGTPFIVGIRHSASSGLGYVQGLSNSISINGLDVSLTTNRKLSFGYFVGSDTFVLGTGPGYANVQRIGEVIQYDRALTDSEMRRVEGYLCWKWNATIGDVSHAYRRFSPSLTSSFNPSSMLPGCSLWLDAADIGTLTTTGSVVTSWRDKSGRGFNVSFPTGPTTGTAVQNGNNVLAFSSSLGSNLSCLIPADDHTLIAVHRPSAVESNTSLFRFQSGTAIPYVVFPYYGGGTARGWVTSQGDATLDISGAGLPEGSSTSSYTMVMACIASASQEVFSNGILVASNTQVLTTSNISLRIGATSTGTQFYGGNVGELLMFRTKLLTPQRQLLEGYLAGKWGVPLPATHPYRAVSSGLTHGGAVSRQGLVQWLSPDTYTRADGSLWVARVGNPFTISGNQVANIITLPGGGNALDVSRGIFEIRDASNGFPRSLATTIEIWVNLGSNSGNGTVGPTSFWAEYSNNTFSTSAGSISTACNVNGIPRMSWNAGMGATRADISYNSGVTQERWMHITSVVPGSGTQTATFYWNGIAYRTLTGTVTRPTSRSYFQLLDRSRSNFGQIGDFRVYDRALTAEDVKANYNAQALRYGLHLIG